MPEWLLKCGVSKGYSWAVSYLVGHLRKDKPSIAAVKMYRAGGTFLEIARAYAAATPEVMDDRIVESIEQLKRDLTVVPLNQLVTQNYFLVLLAATKVPDFDSDPSNDQPVTGLLSKIIDESLTKE